MWNIVHCLSDPHKNAEMWSLDSSSWITAVWNMTCYTPGHLAGPVDQFPLMIYFSASLVFCTNLQTQPFNSGWRSMILPAQINVLCTNPSPSHEICTEPMLRAIVSGHSCFLSSRCQARSLVAQVWNGSISLVRKIELKSLSVKKFLL